MVGLLNAPRGTKLYRRLLKENGLVKLATGDNTDCSMAGTHVAVLIGLVDMGPQEVEFQGPVSQKRQVYLLWELPGEKIAGTGKNHVIGTSVTYSLNSNATLRKWIEGRTGARLSDGAEYDLSQELGQGCLLSVVMNSAGYPRVEVVAGLPKGLPAPAPTYKLTSLSVDDVKAGAVVPDWFPWLYGTPLLDHIKASAEIGGAAVKVEKDATANTNETIPF